MYLSLSRATAGRDLPWPEFVSLAGRTGYDAVDVELDAVHSEGMIATSDFLAEHKLKPAACGLPVNFQHDDATFNQGMQDLDQYAELAAKLGCPRMATWVLPAFETPARKMRKILRNRVTEIAQVLARYDVRVGLEFITPLHFRRQGQVCIWQMADMLDMCDRCGPNVGLLLDSWHWHHDPDGSVQAIVDAGVERIVHVHLNDSPDLPPDRIRDNQRLLPGEGVIDLAGFLGTLKQIRYRDAVTLEIMGRCDHLHPEDAANLALTAARKLMTDI